MIIRIAGIDMTNHVSGFESVTVNYKRKDEDGQFSKGFASEVRVRGAAWDLVNANLILNPAGKLGWLDFEIVDTCCGGEPKIVFKGIIRGDTVDWCDGECEAVVQVTEHTEDTEAMDCLKSTVIYDGAGGLFNNPLVTIPRVAYCNVLRPGYIQILWFVVGIMLVTNFALLTPLITIITLIVSWINAVIFILNLLLPGSPIPSLGGGFGSQDSLLNQYLEVVGTFNQWATGCGRQHPSPYVRGYITNVCNICGITFESSILNEPSSDYYNMVLFSAPVADGSDNQGQFYIFDNKPLQNGKMFLDDLKQVFNADYRVSNGVLKFERKDYFNTGIPWIDYAVISGQNRVNQKVCYSWRSDETPAYLRIEYGLDAIDAVGNEAKERYADIVEWNIPTNLLQVGEATRLFPFGMARFRDDGITPDILNVYGYWPPYSNIEISSTGALILQQGMAFLPKLLIIDTTSPINNAKVKKYAVAGFDIPANQNYNFPLLINEFGVAANTAYPTNQPNMGLYGRFHAIDNPKLLLDQGKEFTFEFRFTCEELDNFDLTSLIQLPLGLGRINEIEFNFTTRVAVITGDL